MRTLETSVEITQTDLNQVDMKQAGVSQIIEAIGASTLEIVRCPNCGGLSERYYSATQQRLQCDHCDYLMVTCVKTGRVIEAYAPGVALTAYRATLASVQ
jgi:ribosomal protein S27E